MLRLLTCCLVLAIPTDVVVVAQDGGSTIIPKGMPHGWHKIDTEAISYIIFRGDPHQVMDTRTE